MSRQTAAGVPVLLFSVGAATTVASLYYSQPLLPQMARALSLSRATAASIPAVTQLGYATGLITLAPLTDVYDRRRLIVGLTLAIALASTLVALAPSGAWLLCASFGLGVVAVVPQLIVPFAAALAQPEHRGAVVGRVMGGLLTGIILSRALSGLIGGWWGWRTMYWIASAGLVLLAWTFQTQLPHVRSETRMPYGALMRSLWSVWRAQPVLRRHTLIGACGFAAFSVFWTALAFHLERLMPTAVGEAVALLALFGIAGALAAPWAGRVADRLGAPKVNALGLAVAGLAFVWLRAYPNRLSTLAVGVVLLDTGVQMSLVANQTRIYGLSERLRGRLTALYMSGYFLGGASGSLLSGGAWRLGGWPAVCVAGGTCAGLGLLVLALPGTRGGRRKDGSLDAG